MSRVMFSFISLALCAAVVSSFTGKYLVKVCYTQQLCADGAWGRRRPCDHAWRGGGGLQTEKGTGQARPQAPRQETGDPDPSEVLGWAPAFQSR